MKLTQANIAKIKIEGGKSERIEFDEAMPGFGLRIRSGDKSESRTFIVQYKIGAKHRRITLGNVSKINLDTAKQEAKRIFGKVATGKDPAAEKNAARREASNTLDAIITEYLEAKKGVLRPATYYATEYYLNRLWKPVHGVSAASATRATIAATTRAIARQNGVVTANRARASLSAMFVWAIGEGKCDANPVIGTNKQEEAAPRDRVLTDEEAAAVWLGLPEGDYGNIVRLLMLTGCRRDEIGGLRWSEYDEEAKTITLPATRTKNGKAHVVPLSCAALAILKAMPRRAGRDCVFGNGVAGFAGWSKAKLALDAKVKLVQWTIHDLRRTVRTGLGMLGVAPHVAEAVLNHLPPKLIRTYDRNSYEDEKRKALELWSGHLAVAIGKATGANVTVLAGQ